MFLHTPSEAGTRHTPALEGKPHLDWSLTARASQWQYLVFDTPECDEHLWFVIWFVAYGIYLSMQRREKPTAACWRWILRDCGHWGLTLSQAEAVEQFAVRKGKMQREMVTVRRCEELHCNEVEEHHCEMKGSHRTRNCARTQQGECQHQKVYRILEHSYCTEQGNVSISKPLPQPQPTPFLKLSFKTE